jgi:hypothetical protein
MEKFINDKGRMRELVRVVSADSACGYVTTYRDTMKPDDVEFGAVPLAKDFIEAGEELDANAGDVVTKAATPAAKKPKK